MAVDPGWVVFSAGSGHGYPSARAVGRYLDHGVPPERLLRTDLGDDEGRGEWRVGREAGGDRTGGDAVEVWLADDGRCMTRFDQRLLRAGAFTSGALSLRGETERCDERQ